jgi:hypothetical protein
MNDPNGELDSTLAAQMARLRCAWDDFVREAFTKPVLIPAVKWLTRVLNAISKRLR